jgi:hypothetical protein
MIETTVSYLASMAERPTYYLYEPPPGRTWRNTKGERRHMPIHDARQLTPPPALDREGFILVPIAAIADDVADPAVVRAHCYPAVERLVAQHTGAARVLAFDHNVRCAARTRRGDDGVQGPVRYAHNDYTERSGPQRVRDLLDAADADARLRRRFAVINFWAPLRHPVRNAPLAVCDAQTIQLADFVPTDLHYVDRVGEVYSLHFSAAHRWFYFPTMTPQEALLLKCFDSDHTRARFTAHTAVDDPTSPADAPPRESIEVRTLAFFA